MLEEEIIGGFNGRLSNIGNEMFMLGEKLSEEKLVSTMKLEELMGSLRTFEMNLDEECGEKKNKGISLKADADNDDSESRYDDEDLYESITLLTKNMGRVRELTTDLAMVVHNMFPERRRTTGTTTHQGSQSLLNQLQSRGIEDLEYSVANMMALEKFNLSVLTP